MRNFAIQCYSTYKGLFYWLNWPGYISNVFLVPVAQVVIFGLIGRFVLDDEAGARYAIGISVIGMSQLALGALTQSYFYERALGTFAILVSSKASRTINYLGRPVLHYPNSVLSMSVGLLAGWLFIGLQLSDVSWGTLVVSTLVIVGAVVAFGNFFGVVSLGLSDWNLTFTISFGLLVLLTGIIIPVETMPAWLQEIAKLLPVTNGLVALRAAFEGVPIADVAWELYRELILIAGYGIAGLGLFRLLEWRMKRQGTLELEPV